MDLDPAAAAAGFGLVVYDTLGSTNAEALARARAGEPGPLWIVAREQTAGRGRRGRSWVSPRGNLYATLLLSDPSPADRAAELPFVAGLALHDAVAEFAAESRRFRLKWPNDLLHDGRKIAGILIEGEGTRPLAVAIGIGVNCVSHPVGTETPAADLAGALLHMAAAEVLRALSRTMLARLRQWDRGGGFARVRADWLARAQGVGEAVAVRLHDRTLNGVFETLDSRGQLILRKADGTREAVTAGDVFPLAQGAAERA